MAKIIAGEAEIKLNSNRTIGAEGREVIETKSTSPNTTLAHRIAAVDLPTGMKSLPADFDTEKGDWQIIKSTNPFEVLFLDYKQYNRITPQVVKQHYSLLEQFWQNKLGLMATGGNRVAFRSIYGEGIVENSLETLRKAFEKIKTQEGIESYYREVNNKRLAQGTEAIKEYIDLALSDGELTTHEVNAIVAKGLQNGLRAQEIEHFVLAVAKERGFAPRSEKPYEHPFDVPWRTEEAQKRFKQSPKVVIYGKEATSLDDIGAILFGEETKALDYVSTTNYLPTEVTKLTNSDKGLEVEQIIREEKDKYLRYLKVVYFLNPLLPFRLETVKSESIQKLFQETAKSINIFSAAAREFSKGRLQVWLKESDPESFEKLPKGRDFLSFLEFLYRISPEHPFYLKDRTFENPLKLVFHLRTDHSNWAAVAELMENGQLIKWLEGIGEQKRLEKYNHDVVPLLEAAYLSETDKKMAAVQTFMLVFSKTEPPPSIITDVKNISLLTLEGIGETFFSIKLCAVNNGFIKAVIYLSENVEGIALNKAEVTLHPLIEKKEEELTLFIDTTFLQKDELYNLEVVVHSEYHELRIPVEIKVVFPKKAYISMLVKYALLGCFIIGGLRVLLGLLVGGQSMTSRTYFYPLSTKSAELPDNYFAYFIIMILTLAVLFITPILIKKKEKI